MKGYFFADLERQFSEETKSYDKFIIGYEI